MKKIIFIISIISILTFNTSIAYCYSESQFVSSNIEKTSKIYSSKIPIINSKNVIVIDRKTLLPLYEKNAYEKVAMASTTKILTCIIALETCSKDDIVIISKKAANINGSTFLHHAIYVIKHDCNEKNVYNVFYSKFNHIRYGV